MKRVLIRFSALILIIILMLSVVGISPVSAASGLSVSGTLADVTLSPGQTYIHTIGITNNSTYPADMLVDVRGFGQSPEGVTVELAPEDDTSPYTARPFISNIDNTSFHLESGGSQQVKATISVPTDTTPGTRYAVIYIHSQPGGSSSVGIVVAVDVLVILRIPGSEPVKKGEITNLDIPEIESGKPIQVLTTFKNTGSIHFKVKNHVTITDENEQIVSQTETPLSSSSILPGLSRLFTVTPSLSDSTDSLPAGRYFAESKMVLDDGTPLDTKKTSFDVEENYQPTSAPSTTSTPVSKKTTSTTTTSGTNWPMIAIIATSIIVISAIVIAFLMTRQKEIHVK